jgi:hypothetical protein
MFDIAECSSFEPDVLRFSVTAFPLSQQTAMTPGTIYLEVTVFSDNAAPLKRWIGINWKGGLDLGGNFDDRMLREPPIDAVSRLAFDDRDSTPSPVEDLR